MQRTSTILAILLTIPLAGCVLSGKSKKVQAPAAPTPAPVQASSGPPPPLSIPQTSAQLPPAQPVPEAALATQPPEEEPRPVVVPPPKPVPKNRPRPEPPKVEAPPAPAPEPGRQPVQEVLRPEERNRHHQEAIHARGETSRLLSRVSARVQRQLKDRVDAIKTFLQQSEDFERRGDMRQANELAQRALVLARELR